MPIAYANKTDGKDDTVQTVYTTLSVVPMAGAGYLLWVTGGSAAATALAPNVPPTGVTGMGMTWVQVDTLTTGNGTDNLSLWRAFSATPSTGALTVTWAVAQDSFAYKLVEVTGMSTAGTNGSGMAPGTNTSKLAAVGPAAPGGPISGALPSAQQAGNRAISGIAYNGADAQTLTVGTTNAAALIGPIGGRSLSPAIQLGVEALGNGTAWDWSSTNQGGKAVITTEITVAAAGSGSIANGTLSVTEKTSGSSVAGGTAFTTGNVLASAGSGYLLWVMTAINAGAVSPSTVTGMNMTWVKVDEQATANANVNLSLWRAYTNVPVSSALTINYASSITTGTVEWKVSELTGMSTTGVNGAGMIRGTNITKSAYTTTGNVVTALSLTTNSTGLVVSGLGYNTGQGNTISAGTAGTYTLLGGPIQIGTPVAGSMAVEGTGTPSSTNVDWNTSSTASKALIAVEVNAAGATTPLTVTAGADQVVDGTSTASATAVASGGNGGTTFSWTRTNFTGVWTPTLTGATTATTSFVCTPDRTGNIVTLQVTATDTSGATATDSVVITVAPWSHWTRRSGALAVRRKNTQRP